MYRWNLSDNKNFLESSDKLPKHTEYWHSEKQSDSKTQEG